MLDFKDASGGGTIVETVLDLLKRLTAGLQLVRLSEEAIPALVASGSTSQANADVILGQLPALRRDIDEQVKAAKTMMSTIQDRLETVAQFLLLHRKSLRPSQADELDRWLDELRG